jgi:hypothetical protein
MPPGSPGRSPYGPSANRIWDAARPITPDTEAWKWLREARQIEVPLSASLRAMRELLHRDASVMLPALIAAITRLDGSIAAVERHYLAHDGSARADLGRLCNRPSLGPFEDGAVHLAEDPGQVLALAEGLTSGLAFMELNEGAVVWSVCGGARFARVAIPPSVRRVIIVGDNDTPEGPDMAHAGAAEWRRRGLETRVILPPDGHDFGSLLTATNAARRAAS